MMSKGLEVGVSARSPNLQHNGLTEKVQYESAIDKEKLSEMNYNKDKDQQQEKQLKFNNEKPDGDSRNQATEIPDVINNSTSPTSINLDITKGLFKKSRAKENVAFENNEIPSLNLSLKRYRDVEETASILSERNVLTHSKHNSAFSR